MFVLVCHAGEKRSWHGPGVDRPLSIIGYWQAQGLVAALHGIVVNPIVAR